jgi:hypothetical protein
MGGSPPLTLEVRLDAVAAVLLDGLSYRRAGRMVGISKTEVGDSLDLLLGALGFCQPDGSFVTTLDQLGERLAEMTRSSEAVVLDGLATQVQRPQATPRVGQPEGAVVCWIWMVRGEGNGTKER